MEIIGGGGWTNFIHIKYCNTGIVYTATYFHCYNTQFKLNRLNTFLCFKVGLQADLSRQRIPIHLGTAARSIWTGNISDKSCCGIRIYRKSHRHEYEWYCCDIPEHVATILQITIIVTDDKSTACSVLCSPWIGSVQWLETDTIYAPLRFFSPRQEAYIL